MPNFDWLIEMRRRLSSQTVNRGEQTSIDVDIEHARLIEQAMILNKRLITGCALTLLGLFAWSALATVPQAAHGEARVVPSQRLQIIQAVDGGIITDVMVREGELVRAGQTLVQIDTTRFSSSLKEKEAIEASLKLREARLIAQLKRGSMEVSGNLQDGFPQLYLQESMLLQTKLQEWNAQTEIFEQQLNQRQRELDEAQSRALAAKSSLDISERELASLRPLLRSGAVSPVEVLRLEREVARAKGDYDGANAQINRLRSAIGEARQKIQEVNLKQQNEARTELSELKGRLASLEQNQVELSDRVNQATLRAPVDGLVQRILFNTRGAVVPAGREVIELVPIDEELVFETRVNPRDIAFIKPEQHATVRVTAYDYTLYGALKGKVAGISADSLFDEYGNPYFVVRVTVPRTDIHSELRLIPGMVAEVSIQTDERTVLSYLTKPFHRAYSRAFTER